MTLHTIAIVSLFATMACGRSDLRVLDTSVAEQPGADENAVQTARSGSNPVQDEPQRPPPVNEEDPITTVCEELGLRDCSERECDTDTDCGQDDFCSGPEVCADREDGRCVGACLPITDEVTSESDSDEAPDSDEVTSADEI